MFETAGKKLPKASVNSISIYLSVKFEETYGHQRDARAFSRYYKFLVNDGVDYNIDDVTLLYLSKYIGYKDFEDFCSKVHVDGGDGSTILKLAFGDSLSEKIQQVFITVNPVFKMPDFVKKNGMGIMEMTLLVCLVTGGVLKSGDRSQTPDREGIIGGHATSKDKIYMYWNGAEYIATDSSYIRPEVKVIALKKEELLHFKKIKIPDTITERSLHKIWYSKKNNKVEFFTADGNNPENGKSLNPLTEHILYKYRD
ncbi:hypothetical protein [Chryseobacterium sp. Leaf180]|uniref:hypothetical protein n=1 Tax=Chryseobacterium sp. Leaf180 TaxID=1736289 RepID=UPI001040654B|nr:hypothetical protein [Chryseobacterium sp. Leaf180]